MSVQLLLHRFASVFSHILGVSVNSVIE